MTALAAVKALSNMVENRRQQLWSKLLLPDTMRLISAGHRSLLTQNLEPLLNISQYGRTWSISFGVAQVKEIDAINASSQP